MTIISTGEISKYPNMDDMGWAATASLTQTFDGAADSLAVILHVPATGTISNVHYWIHSVTSDVLTLRIELRTVDATTGLPNAAGTLYGSSTSITSANPTAGAKTAAVNCTGATKGDLIAVVFDLSAYTSGSFAFRERIGAAMNGGIIFFPYIVPNTAGSAAVAASAMNCFALEYSGTTYYPLEINACVGTLSSPTVTSTGSIRRGNRFRPPFSYRACGMYVYGDLDGDTLLRIRKASDDSILATATLDKDVRGGASTGQMCVLFDAGATANLTAGVDYYALLEGNSATTSTISLLSAIPTNQIGQLAGGVNCYGTLYSSSVYNDDATQRYAVGILYDGIDAGPAQLVDSGGLVG